MSGMSAGKISPPEKNNQTQGRSGGGTKKKNGPVTGMRGRKSRGGGIASPTKGKKSF